jgi:hypothetical protein
MLLLKQQFNILVRVLQRLLYLLRVEPGGFFNAFF